MNKLKVFRVPFLLIIMGVACMILGNLFGKNIAELSSDSVDLGDPSKSQIVMIQDGASNSAVTDWRVITEYHQNRLETFLKHVKGVGEVSVLVYCDGSSVLSLADNDTSEMSTVKENDGNGGERITDNVKNQSDYLVLQDQNGNQKIVALSETLPAITSVCVVCTGGNQAGVQERVIQAVGTLYHLPPSKIVVIPGA